MARRLSSGSTARYACNALKLECPEISWIVRSGTPALLMLVRHVRRIECVDASSRSNESKTFLRMLCACALVRCPVAESFDGNNHLPASSSSLYVARASFSLGCVGMSLNTVFFRLERFILSMLLMPPDSVYTWSYRNCTISPTRSPL